MPSTKCRVCSRNLYADPLLRYGNMPKAAQFLPDRNSLAKDQGVDLEICQCSGCGLVQLRNDPVPYYKEVVRASAVSEEMRAFRCKQFDRFVQDFSLKGKKTIEIGCGRGEYLSLLQQSGIDAYGVEYAEESVRDCVANGLKVSRGFVHSPDCRLNHAPFDVFFILNFLEHLPDPNGTLSGIHANLIEGGIGLVEVPNFDMILKKQLFSEFIGDHLFYFTRQTLETTLKLNGFEMIDCREEWHQYILSAVVKKRERLDLSSFCRRQAQLKKEISEFIGRFADGQVAIWGAGHQALAVISLTDLAGKIRYIVDSAPFKQDKYTPATHLPIVSPAILDADPVDAVIIMAASYSDEVAGILRKKFGGKMTVAILRDFGLQNDTANEAPRNRKL